MIEDPSDVPVPGVEALDHTADVGLEVRGADLAEVVARAVRGLTWLLLERTPSGAPAERKLRVTGDGPASLLREALRELLWWHDSEGLSALDVVGTRVEDAGEGLTLEASVRLAADARPPLREIKGVTLHGLVAEPRNGGWYARVVFDV